ncbi:DUF4844 domain-containing protein [Acinetobacter sp. NIPH 298]|uniref:DUF4844 domain-containing protein n=1 Tax=Acinetobacter sp. NIPH 298 TaxID=1217692 RepID=UPI0002CFBD8E|nr:DUF4844 domain-containing protein [Acinetobacter sp. NIPH 298]ENW97624.1 hypothetical protein F903_00140 [Acinetobacter sp. NIPH 298]
MKLLKILLVTGLLLLNGCSQANENKMNSSNVEVIELLEQFKNQDHFSEDGILYTGVQDKQLKDQLNQKVENTTQAYIELYTDSTQPTKTQLLKILSDGIHQIDPNTLDTEDREQVATTFEHFLDITGLESSEGILNTWLYGEEINQLIERNHLNQ